MPVKTITPLSATPMPIQTRRSTYAPRHLAKTAAQIGCAATSAVDDATEGKHAGQSHAANLGAGQSAELRSVPDQGPRKGGARSNQATPEGNGQGRRSSGRNEWR